MKKGKKPSPSAFSAHTLCAGDQPDSFTSVLTESLNFEGVRLFNWDGQVRQEGYACSKPVVSVFLSQLLFSELEVR